MADTLLHEVGTRQHLHFFYGQLFHKTNRFLPHVYLSSRQHFVTIIRTKWRLFKIHLQAYVRFDLMLISNDPFIAPTVDT